MKPKLAIAAAIVIALCCANNSMPNNNEAGIRYFLPLGDGAASSELLVKSKTSQKTQTPLGERDSEEFDLYGGGEKVAKAKIISFAERDGFSAVVYETTILKDIVAPTGDYFNPIAALPAIPQPAFATRVLTFATSQFSPPVYEAAPTTGPVLLYNDKFETMMISPLDNFMEAMTAPVGGEWRCGFGGLLAKIPAGTTHRVLVVRGHGINDTFEHWGDFVRGWHKRTRTPNDADVGLKYIGYYTDNGAYYYYKTAPGMNYHDTLMAVKKDADRRGIPYGYFQVDSWWYPKAGTNTLLGAFRGGAMLWEPIPELFPRGLDGFQKELGLPLVTHNRWYSKRSPYCERYECVDGRGFKNPALPIEPAFWDEIMNNAVKYGAQVYEQDWLETQMSMIPWLRKGFGNASGWFDSIMAAAGKRGLTMQLCMASPEFFLEQTKTDVVTHARASGDYLAGYPKTKYWPKFHVVSMLAYAVGIFPFKDVFQSSSGQRKIRDEKFPLEETLISLLSAGPVGPGDKIGAADATLLKRTCRSDGVLIKPDKPAMPIDPMFIDNRKPWIVTTETKHDIGNTIYLAAFNLDPKKTPETFITFAELGIKGDYAVYDWRGNRILTDADKIDFGNMPKYSAHYYMLCPRLDNGMVVIGEAEKLAPLGRARFRKISYANGRIDFDILGAPGEVVEISTYSKTAPSKIVGGELKNAGGSSSIRVVEVKIGSSGEAILSVE